MYGSCTTLGIWTLGTSWTNLGTSWTTTILNKQTNRSCFVDTGRYTRFSQRFLRYEWILCSWTARLWPPWTHEMAIILAVSLQLERRMTCRNFSGARWHGTQCIGCGLTVSHLLFFLFPAWRSFKADELHAFGFLAPGVVGILIDIDYWNPHHSTTIKGIIRFRTPMLRLLSINRILLIESPEMSQRTISLWWNFPWLRIEIWDGWDFWLGNCLTKLPNLKLCLEHVFLQLQELIPCLDRWLRKHRRRNGLHELWCLGWTLG